MDPDEVLRVEDAILILLVSVCQLLDLSQVYSTCDHGQGGNITYLTGSINNLGGVLLVLVLDDFTERILDGRVVALHEMAIYELYCKGRFSCVDFL